MKDLAQRLAATAHSGFLSAKSALGISITPVWMAGVCILLAIAAVAAANHDPVSSSSHTSPASSAVRGDPSQTLSSTQPTLPSQTGADSNINNSEEPMNIHSQSVHNNTSVNMDASGTTVTVNGQTQKIAPGESVDTSTSQQNGGTTTKLHVSSQSTTSGDAGAGSSSQSVSVQVNSSSHSEGSTSP